MAGVSSLGVGSGLDLNGLVTNLLKAEGQGPSNRLNKKESTFQLQLSAIGTLKGALASFESAVGGMRNRDLFLRYLTTTSDAAIVSPSVTGEVAVGSHTVEVTQLAQAQTLATKTSYANITDIVGTGKLSFTVAGTTKSVDINNGSLQGIRDAVNSAGVGITASVVNNGAGYQLVLATQTGVANQVTISVVDSDGNNTDAAGLSALAYAPNADPLLAVLNMDEKTQAKDAKAILDGILVSSASNTLNNAIDGLSLTFKKEAVGTKVTVGVGQDTAAMSKAVSDFVEGYNATIKSIKDLSFYDSKTKQAGPLLGDSTVRGFMSELRQIIVKPVGSSANNTYNSLASIGVVSQSDGSLKLDAVRLQTALTTKPQQVRNLLAGGEELSSDPTVRYLKVPESLPDGPIGLAVSKLATSGTYTGAVASGFILGADSVFVVTVDGKTSGSITISTGNYASNAAIAVAIQTKINADSALKSSGTQVTAAYDAVTQKYVLSAKSAGVESKISIVSANASANTDLGVGTALGASAAGTDIAGTIGGLDAFAAGRFLYGTKRFAGLKIEVSGGDIGTRNPIRINHGVTDRIDEFLKKILASNGSVEAKTTGIKSQITDIGTQRVKLNNRLETLKAFYTKQFSSLDVLVAKSNATGSALTGQLASLPGSVRKN